MKKISIAILLLFVTLNLSFAATSRSSYVIEVLVFQHSDKNSDNEMWPLEKPAPIPGLDSAAPVKGEIPSYAKFKNTVERLAENKKYKVLAHKRWFQYAGAKSTAKPVRISGGDDGDMVVDGTFIIFSKYYIYVDLNMQLRNKAKKEAKKDDDNASPVYSLVEKRRVKLKQINYFDHPKFGMLVYVRPAR